jgi:hypothetical protein
MGAITSGPRGDRHGVKDMAQPWTGETSDLRAEMRLTTRLGGNIGNRQESIERFAQSVLPTMLSALTVQDMIHHTKLAVLYLPRAPYRKHRFQPSHATPEKHYLSMPGVFYVFASDRTALRRHLNQLWCRRSSEAAWLFQKLGHTCYSSASHAGYEEDSDP